ncbi:MAG: hypothetical protein V4592_05575 [Bacteroidota bacterium]
MNHHLLTMNPKKYILKPGKHQFAPGEHARHDNDNLTDAEAKWYLERYPHIRSLFSDSPEVGKTESPKVKSKIRQKRKSEIEHPKPEIT